MIFSKQSKTKRTYTEDELISANIMAQEVDKKQTAFRKQTWRMGGEKEFYCDGQQKNSSKLKTIAEWSGLISIAFSLAWIQHGLDRRIALCENDIQNLNHLIDKNYNTINEVRNHIDENDRKISVLMWVIPAHGSPDGQTSISKSSEGSVSP